MTDVRYYISTFKDEFLTDFQLWEITPNIRDLIGEKIRNLGSHIKDEIAIHQTAKDESSAQNKSAGKNF